MTLLKAQKPTKLLPEELKWTCPTENFDFESTTSVKPIEGIVGQERALKALKLGVDLKSPGYNIFITGLSGTGKYTTIKKTLETLSPSVIELYDYAYVNNFSDTDRPILLVFPAGTAKNFKEELSNAIKFLQENIPQVLETEPFVTHKKQLFAAYSETQQSVMHTFEDKLRKDNFSLGQIKVGEMTRPEILAVVDDQPLFISQIDDLVRQKKINEDQAKNIREKYASYQQELQILFRNSLKLSQDFQKKISDLEQKAVTDMLRVVIDELQKKFNIEKVQEFLDSVEEDILNNLDIFKGHRPASEQTSDGYIIDYFRDYEVNIILDNSATSECPVIIETSPTYGNLFGVIEKYSDGRGGWFADFTKIKGGSLIRANGGYLVINAIDAYTEPGVWKTLKRVLMYGKLDIQDMTNLYQFTPSSLKPESISIDAKIILIGNNEIYSLLSEYEQDFNKIFKVKAEFDYAMNRTEKAITEYTMLIKKLIDSENLLEFDKAAIATVIEYGARYAGEQEKLTTRFAYIADLCRESSFWANDVGNSVVSDYHVKQAYETSRERHGLYEAKVSEMIEKGSILIDTDGERVGQINGLAVYGGSNGFSFGKPTRITASVSLGNGNIVNVEREAGLSGSSHNKGVLIISGYFKEKFGKKIPLSFNANLVFEQGYGMIDGDSASITEICALLSSLSEIPIKQSIAITGSVNQKGDIQPIGGVNEKVEGFFDICKTKGLTKKQGVIIPIQNVKDLMLKQEIIDAVKNNEFNIYPVTSVEEAIEILTGIKAGKEIKPGLYEKNTIFGMVECKLKEMRKILKPAPAPKQPEVKSTKTKRKNK